MASAIKPIIYALATHFALPTSDKLIRTAARSRKPLDVYMHHLSPLRETSRFLKNLNVLSSMTVALT